MILDLYKLASNLFLQSKLKEKESYLTHQIS